ncbi:MAG: GDSL-type esterase/lipase family protein [Tepidiformaceae bacterium]
MSTPDDGDFRWPDDRGRGARLRLFAPAFVLLVGAALVGAAFWRGAPAVAAPFGHVIHASGIARDGTPVTPTSTPTPSPTPTPVPKRHPISAAGLRVWADGDSTSYFVSVAVLSMLGAEGAIEVQDAPEYKISSGLMSPGFFDWPAYLASQMERTWPDVVVFMLGANDAVGAPSADVYRERVAAVMDELDAPGRTVVWVGQPHMGVEPSGRNLSPEILVLNQVFEEEAAKRPWVIYVDTWALTSDAAGNYARDLPDENGVLETMRGDDGIHLSAAGGRRIAQAVIAALFAP